MDKKMTLTEDNLRLAASYLNLNDEGQTLLETLTNKLAETEQEKKEKEKEKNERARLGNVVSLLIKKSDKEV